MLDRALLWLADRRPPVRIALAALVAVLVYGAGWLVAVVPLEERASELEAEADRTARRLETDRRRIERFRPAPEALTAGLDSLRRELSRTADTFPGGLRSGLLTAFSSAAENAGAGSPLFNLRSAPGEAGELDGLEILTVVGDLEGGTRAVAGLLERLGAAPVPVVVDSLDLTRGSPENRASLRLRVLTPAGGE